MVIVIFSIFLET